MARSACAIFPADNVWNADVSALPVHAMSATWIASIGATAPLHPDFGSGLYSGGMIGIPYTIVPAIQPLVPISFYYGDESDPGPYPIPPFAPIEGGRRPGMGRGDRHVLIVDDVARHFASSSTDPALPPMGIRLRLKASVDIGGYSAANQ